MFSILSIKIGWSWYHLIFILERLYLYTETPPWKSATKLLHYRDVIISTMASQITSLPIVYLTVYSGGEQRKHQSSASLAFVRGIHWWPVNSSHKGPITRKMFPFDDVIVDLVIPEYSVSATVLQLLLVFVNYVSIWKFNWQIVHSTFGARIVRNIATVWNPAMAPLETALPVVCQARWGSLVRKVGQITRKSLRNVKWKLF